MASGVRICKKCELEKPEADFLPRKDSPNRRGTCRACRYLQANTWRSNNRDKVKGYSIKFKYGIPFDEYQQWCKDQDNKCLICGCSTNDLHIDHCHETNKIRGLLCQLCNVGLGSFRDNVESINKAAKYLQNFENTNERSQSI